MTCRIKITGNHRNKRTGKISLVIVISLMLVSCASVPRETVALSGVLGSDLAALQTSHRELALLYFDKIKDDINVFVDEVYSPFVIHYVLKAEYDRYKKGEPSLFRAIENASVSEASVRGEDVLNTMSEFQQAAIAQIQAMRNELLDPVEKQEMQVIDAINSSYEQAIRANITITGYLESVRKVKESQQELMALAGFEGADSSITASLLRMSELVNAAVKKGKAIDIKGEKALLKIEEISSQIKNITN